MILSVILILFKLLALYLLYDRILKQWYLRIKYGMRGATFMSTIPKPIIGDMLEFVSRVMAKPDAPHFTKWLQDVYPKEVPSCIGIYKSNGLQLVITDADYIQDCFRTYNECFTKHNFAQNLFSKFMWNSIIWAPTAVPSYKPRRQLIAHAFYASKLKAMSNTMFEVIHSRMIQWPQLFPDGRVDLVAELSQIQGQLVVSVSIGTDHANEELPFLHHETKKVEQMRIGNFINALTGEAILRDS